MKCSSNHYVSGDFCHLCGETLKEKKVPVKGIKKVSDKRAKEAQEYSRLKKEFLEKNPRCAVYKNLKAVDVHHQKGKLGPLYLDTRFWLPVSRKAHSRITDDSKWAVENGYSILRNVEHKEDE
jgi:hypothetical protein